MDIKILLINPPFIYLEEPHAPHLGIINLGTILEHHGFEIRILDINAEKQYGDNFLPNPLTPKEFLNQYRKYDPDLVGISAVTENYPITLKIARMCKRENLNIKIFVGGYHTTFQAEECLRENPIIDLVALGEVEHVIADIIKGLIGKLELNKIDNIKYRDKGIIKTSHRVSLPDLSKIPSPNLDLIKHKKYPSFSPQVEFSRGCPFHCIFCCQSPVTERRVRYFPAKRVVDTLEAYQARFNSFSFDITDPTFLLDQKKVHLFLAEVKNRKMELRNWLFKTRVDLLTRDILKELKKFNAGISFIGVEDIHDSVLQAMGKQITINQIERGIKILKDLNYVVKANFVIGLPSQTKEHMLENIAYSNKFDHFNFTFISPFPGTPIFNHPEAFGLSILTKKWELYHGMEPVMESNVFSVEQQKELRDLAWQHKAAIQLEREFSMIHPRSEWERLLELGFPAWYEEWKEKYSTGWL